MTAVQEENDRLWKLVGALTDALQEALENLDRMGEGVKRVRDKEELGLEYARESVGKIGRLKEQIAVVRDLHQEHGCVGDRIFCADFSGQCTRAGTCEHCRYKYPCPTIRAVEEAR